MDLPPTLITFALLCVGGALAWYRDDNYGYRGNWGYDDSHRLGKRYYDYGYRGSWGRDDSHPMWKRSYDSGYRGNWGRDDTRPVWKRFFDSGFRGNWGRDDSSPAWKRSYDSGFRGNWGRDDSSPAWKRSYDYGFRGNWGRDDSSPAWKRSYDYGYRGNWGRDDSSPAWKRSYDTGYRGNWGSDDSHPIGKRYSISPYCQRCLHRPSDFASCALCYGRSGPVPFYGFSKRSSDWSESAVTSDADVDSYSAPEVTKRASFLACECCIRNYDTQCCNECSLTPYFGKRSSMGGQAGSGEGSRAGSGAGSRAGGQEEALCDACCAEDTFDESCCLSCAAKRK